MTAVPNPPGIYTCLWFDGRIDEAAEFYVDTIPGSRVTRRVNHPKGHDFPGNYRDTDLLLVDLEIAGASFQLLNGGPHFPQTEAASIAVIVEDQAEVDRIWAALIADGGQESQCGWCKDRFGVSWQVCPRGALALMTGLHAGAVGAAMAQMRKLNLAALEAAARADGWQG